ncbi:sigma factor [Corallococcus sp. CA047B]|uniref:sigma factor n=1 Tax=Corallococcus sp. CA047B TaxID=2316729 RepID=UPI001F25D8EB|nr:sigma factor [Corallococcus sp. CA047B]
MESLLFLLRELPDGCPEQRRAEAHLTRLVLPYVARLALAVARTWKVSAEDLQQEGLLATLGKWRRFTPGRRPGGCLYPAYVVRLARQAMERHAAKERSAVHVTRHARRKLARAKRAAHSEGVKVSDVLRRQGMEDAGVHALGEGAIATLSLDELLTDTASADTGHARRSGASSSVELRLSLVDTTAVRLAQVAEREDALSALHRLPRLQRVVVQASTGLGRPGGQEASERTLAQELRLSAAKVRKLRERGLSRLRSALDARGHGPELPARAAGKVRGPRSEAPRDARPRQVGQVAQLGLQLSGAGA